MLRNTILSSVLSVAIGITSMPAIAAPLAPSMPQFDNPSVTEVARRWRGRGGWRGARAWRGHRGWRGRRVVRNRTVVVRRGGRYWGGCGGWGCGYDGYGVGAGIVGFGLGAALAAPYYGGYYGGRCYVIQGGIRYLVACDSLY
jgi:hypothetical protein